jgi:gas vesicle protein
MADGFDRNDNDNNGGGSFVMGLLTGTVLGAGLGMLFAPKPGSDLRHQVREQAGNLANTATDGYRRAADTAGEYASRVADTAGQYAERGRDMAGDIAGRAREAVAKGTEEAQRYVRDASGGSSDLTDRMATASGSGTSGPTSIGSSPRPAGSPPNDTSHPGGSQSGSGGFGGPRG